MSQALKGEPLTVYGDGTQQRCFCDVGDIVQGVVGLTENERAHGKVFNMGGTEEVSIRELAERIVRIAESSSEIRIVPYEEAYPAGFDDMMRRVPDTTRIRKLTGWEPKFTLDDIIRRVRDSIKGKE